MAAPVANIIGISYVDIASTRMANLQATLDAVMAAEVNVLNPILRALVILYVGRQFLLMMGGRIGLQHFVDSTIRVLLIIFLVLHNANFVQYVRTPVYTTLPQMTSALVGGNYAAITAGQPLAEQFDAIAAKGDAVTVEIDKVSSNWFSMTDWINSGTGHIADGGFQTILAIIVAIWLLGQTLLAIVLALGLPLLLLELFERTRGFVDQWVAKIVGMTAFGFATSFVLALEMQGMKTMFDTVHAAIAHNSAQAASMFWHVVGDSVLDLLTIAALPTAVAFGSGAVAALGAPAAFMVMRSLSMYSAAATAAARAAGQLTRAAGAMGRAANALSRA